MASLTIYQRSDHRWTWRLEDDDGQIIATDAGNGYATESEVAAVANSIVDGGYAGASRHRSPRP